MPAIYCVTIVAQAFVRGFDGAAWYWRLNAVITAVFATAVFATRRTAHA